MPIRKPNLWQTEMHGIWKVAVIWERKCQCNANVT